MIAAAVLAFGFVFVHPFEDGNGRIHRYLIHHVLAARGFNPPGVVFPVSATILDRIDEYRKVLESYSQRLLPLIKWKPTKDGNVEVLNDTADFYRYFDATPQAEFLYSCVRKTVEEDLPAGGRLSPALRRLQGPYRGHHRHAGPHRRSPLPHAAAEQGEAFQARAREGVRQADGR